MIWVTSSAGTIKSGILLLQNRISLFAEKFTAYLKHVRGLADTTVSVEIKSLKHIVKKAFNDGQTDKNPFAYYYIMLPNSRRSNTSPKKKSIN